MKKIFQSFGNAFRPKGKKKSMTLDHQTLKEMIRGIVTTRKDEIACDSCFDKLDQFAEFVLEGKDASEAMPLIQHHLDHCKDCREEFEALMQSLKSLSK
ncbi:MAG: hypothetical protein JSV25_01670 [Spirochaetota bacterium]|nr:MAG: hypothetical protein JSV25_01670 [Spirochaetota bacterium]